MQRTSSSPTDPQVLLISLGTSWAVVPEAFLVMNPRPDEVHVLTTSSDRIELDKIHDFFKDYPLIKVTVSRVRDFTELVSEEDCFNYEEVLYRWLIANSPQKTNRYCCLTGGFKTMSAAMQKAAAVFGACGVFHVLADRNPTTVDDIKEAHAQKKLRKISLGSEEGWPHFTSDDFVRNEAKIYPLKNGNPSPKDGSITISPGSLDTSLRERVRNVVQQSHEFSRNWINLEKFPWITLARKSPVRLSWFNEKMDGTPPENDWIANMPKIELHCHLGGFATNGKLLKVVRDAATDNQKLPTIQAIAFPAMWPDSEAIGLEQYLALGNNNGSTLLKDMGCLKKQCELLYQHLCDQKVVYAEIRCSPDNYTEAERQSAWDVLNVIRTTFQSLMNSHSYECHVNLIIIGTRRKEGDFRSGIAKHLALAVTAAEHWQDDIECRVVGVDLAGYEEKETRAHYFREEFNAVHRCGLALTVHAGENDEAEGIWRAVFDLNARRLGHALSLIDSPSLLRSVVARGIGVEMCPYANQQIKGSKDYPLKKYLDAGVKVSVNTDNIGISAKNLTENLILAGKLCPELTRMDLLRLQRNALDTAFIGDGMKSKLAQKISQEIP